MIKKVIVFVLVLSLALTAAGCAEEPGEEANTSSGQSVEDVKVIEMDDGVTCYVYEEGDLGGISCLRTG